MRLQLTPLRCAAEVKRKPLDPQSHLKECIMEISATVTSLASAQAVTVGTGAVSQSLSVSK